MLSTSVSTDGTLCSELRRASIGPQCAALMQGNTMAAQAMKVRKESLPRRGEATPEELIRLLVGLANTSAPSCANTPPEANSSHSEEILIDLDLDGMRYLLVRMPKADPARVQLSPREQEIVRMVAQGHPNKVIADV